MPAGPETDGDAAVLLGAEQQRRDRELRELRERQGRLELGLGAALLLLLGVVAWAPCSGDPPFRPPRGSRRNRRFRQGASVPGSGPPLPGGAEPLGLLRGLPAGDLDEGGEEVFVVELAALGAGPLDELADAVHGFLGK